MQAGGNYGTTESELVQIFQDDVPRVMKSWKKPKLLLYAHGGLVTTVPSLKKRIASGKIDLVLAPNSGPKGSTSASGARHHRDFDDDTATVLATFQRIAPAAPAAPAAAAKAAKSTVMDGANGAKAGAKVMFMPTKSSLRDKRLMIDTKTRIPGT